MANPAANATGHLAAHGMHPCVVTHGSTAGTARPAIDSASDAITTVWWVGSVAPTNAVTGDHWTDTASLLLKRYNGTGWDVLSLGAAAWTAYTPTLTNITLGNGTVIAASLTMGKTVFVRFYFQFGTTSSIASVAQFSLPVTSLGGIDQALGGVAVTSTQLAVITGRIVGSSTSCQLGAATSTVSATAPFTWTSGNAIIVTGSYEAA